MCVFFHCLYPDVSYVPDYCFAVHRVWVAEYYRIPYSIGVEGQSFAFYDESKDAWQKFSWHELERMAMIGDMREMDSNDADWDDEDGHYEKRVTKLPNYGITADPVDVFVQDTLFKHMTVGEIEGDWNNGFTLQGTGNLVLNPWYALHRFEVLNGAGIAGLAVPTDGGFNFPAVGAGGMGGANADEMRWRLPVVGAVPPYPPTGTRHFNDKSGSEYRFAVFDDILKAFGYTGRSVNWKTDAAIQHIRANGGACGANDDEREACAKGNRDVPDGGVVDYTAALENAACVGSMRGHPDYEHYSYKIARERFHRFFILYLSGKADHLPTKAREFFDNFNWQRLAIAAGDRLTVFSELLSRLYAIENPPAGDRINPGPGIPIGGTRAATIATLIQDTQKDRVELVIVRPNIEHNMLGIIMVCTPCLLASSRFKSHDDVSHRVVAASTSSGPPSGDRQSSAATMIRCMVRCIFDLCCETQRLKLTD